MDALNSFVSSNVGAVAAALAVVVVLLLLVVLVLARRTSSLDRRLRGLTRGSEGASLESVLDAHLDKVYAVSTELDQLAARSAVLESTLRRAIQRTGLVRYNPFDDTGGNQSFAVALLDANGDGVVVSSLHARSGTRIYAKSVLGGRSEAALSDEESEALRQAMAKQGAGAKPS